MGWGVLILGLLLQYGLKDHFFGLRLLFYAMPKPCLLALAVTLLVWPKISQRSRIAALFAACVLASSWLTSSWRMEHPKMAHRDPASEVRILYWNLCRPSGLHEGMVELMREFDPHIAAFVEPGRHDMETKCKAYESMLPGYKAAWMPRGILWFSKVPSRYRARGKLEGAGAFARFDVHELGPTFPVVVADVHPHPFHWRKGQLEEVLEHSLGRSDAILVGDFNTPLESALLKDYRARFTHALEAGGQGFKETWPVGLPLLSLDHLWLGQDWEVVEAKKVWKLQSSDHAALLVTLRRKVAGESSSKP
jgi:endonuclease/exonuclease/phosphatase (EEP) superfamily protein YafD